ncbi:hypothetical protein ACW2QC_01345 [Virgibacillus sp. FSP13]
MEKELEFALIIKTRPTRWNAHWPCFLWQRIDDSGISRIAIATPDIVLKKND